MFLIGSLAWGLGMLQAWALIVAAMVLAAAVLAVALAVALRDATVLFHGVRWMIAAFLGGIVVGLPLAAIRHWIVGPEAPFIRPGYAGIAVIPFVIGLVAGGPQSDVFRFALLAQVPLLLVTAIYVALAGWRRVL